MELTLLRLLMEQEKTGRFPIKVRDALQYKLCGFVAGVARIYENLPLAGQNRVRGMILDGLQTDNGLLSLQHEITTAVHLMRRGFDVDFNDIENGSGVDFVARRGGIEIEVECKMFTGDLGRKIHRRRVLELHNTLAPLIERVYRTASRGIFVGITIPDRLGGQLTQLQGINDALSRAVVSGNAVTKSDHCDIEVKDFDLAVSPFCVEQAEQVTQSALAEFVKKNFGRTNPNLMVFFSPWRRAVVALVESARPDAVLRGMDRQLRQAANSQFSKGRPGVLAIQFHELTADQLLGLAKSDTLDPERASGLQRMTSWVLSSPNRDHIHTVAYRSHGALISHSDVPGAISEQGPAYVFRNPNHPMCNDLKYRVFS